MTPDTAARPPARCAIVDRRPALLGQRPAAARGARVDDRPAEPQPGRRGEEHRGQLQHPVRQDQAKNSVPLPCATISPPSTPTLTAFSQQDDDGRDAEQDRRRSALARRPTRCWSRPARRTRPAACWPSSSRWNCWSTSCRRLRGRQRARPAPPGTRRSTSPVATATSERRRPQWPATTSAPGRPRPGSQPPRTAPRSRQDGACAPVTADRARATRVDSRAASAGSAPARPQLRQVRGRPLVQRRPVRRPRRRSACGGAGPAGPAGPTRPGARRRRRPHPRRRLLPGSA